MKGSKITTLFLVVWLAIALTGGCALPEKRPEAHQRPDPNQTYGREGEPGTGQNPGNDLCSEILAGNGSPRVFGIVAGNVAFLSSAGGGGVDLVRANCPHVVEIRAAVDDETSHMIETYATEVVRGNSLSGRMAEIATLTARTNRMTTAPQQVQ